MIVLAIQESVIYTGHDKPQVLVLTFGGSNPSIPTKAYFVALLCNF